MTDETLQLTLKLEGGPEATDEDVAGLARRLRDDLLELDVEGVKPGEKEAPPGSKTGPVMDWTTLFVTLAASGGVLTVLITAIQNWLMRNQASSLTIKLGDDELTLSGPGAVFRGAKAGAGSVGAPLQGVCAAR